LIFATRKLDQLNQESQAMHNQIRFPTKPIVGLIAVSALAVFVAACDKKPVEPVTVEKVETVSATVEAVDLNTRMLSLRGPEGGQLTVQASPEVRNLAQVKVGDKLVVRYYTSLAAAIKAPGTSTTLNSVDQSAAAARAPEGEKPGAAVGSVETTTVTIQSVDTTLNTVTFSGHDSLVRSVAVKDPEAQKFIAGLKAGDQVELTYTEALAVSVEEAK
jgi:hypothetical protein